MPAGVQDERQAAKAANAAIPKSANSEPSWWVEGAERVVGEAVRRKLISEEHGFGANRRGMAALREAIRAKSDKPAAYLISEDCRKLIEWKDGDKQ